MDELRLTLAKLQEKFPGQITEVSSPLGQDTAVVQRESVLAVARYLKDDLKYNFLMDCTCVDLGPGKEGRFIVVYHFYSLANNTRVRLKAHVPENDPTIDSLTPLWGIANWYEREAWDMFGVKFKGHPNLKRLLLYEEFDGHPLRKDYPINRQQPLLKARAGREFK